MGWEDEQDGTDGIDRRRVLRGFFTMLAAAGLARGAHAQAAPAAPAAPAGRIVRVSRGAFAPEKFDEVKRRLEAAQKTLIPEIRKLSGCLQYVAAIDRGTNTMVNVSVWKSLADANQMQGFPPMIALAEEFMKMGVRFEQPVVNYEELWKL